jgi:hypothetical protein
MTTHKLSKETVLALYFNTIGFGYAVFEGITLPVDWQVRRAKDSQDSRFGSQVRELLEQFDPTVIVIRKCLGKEQWPCSDRTKQRIRQVKALAKRRSIQVCDYSRADIRQCFLRYGATNKDEIARAIGEIVPDFHHLVPPIRRFWENEQYVMGVFDAISLIITFYWAERLDRKHLL